MTELPIQSILSKVVSTLAQHPRLIVQAPPGAGKSTLLPLSLLEHLPQQSGQIWLLEPRRLAAEQVARRLSQGLNETLGHTIGLMTGENRIISQHTKLVVMTEAVLSQRLIRHNDIPNCHTIIFDEFHERNLHTDLGLALALQCQLYLRDDLKLVIMSATLDGDALAQALNCPMVQSEGRSYDVAIEYLPSLNPQTQYLDQDVKRAVSLALSKTQGDILVFLPGVKEIRACERNLNQAFESAVNDKTLGILPLHGQMTAQQQQGVINDQPIQKIILATDIAKTSLTLPKVTTVIDAGLERLSQFNVRQGMDELVTIKASQASAIQRAGRAGRVQAGVCYRLYSQEDFQRRAEFSPLAIEQSDLAPLCLSLAAWGSLEVSEYQFLTQPDATRLNRSLELLQQLDALDQKQLTRHGHDLVSTPLHPRLSHMIVKAHELQLGYSACLLAAILSEGDPLQYQNTNSDLHTRLQLFEAAKLPQFFEGAKVNTAKAQRITQQAKRYASTLNIQHRDVNSDECGALIMLAYPDRIAQRRGQGYRLRNGQGCQIHHGDSLSPSDFLAVAHIQQSQQSGQHATSIIRLACAISLNDLVRFFKDQFITHCRLQLNEKDQLQTISRQQLGELVLKETITQANSSEKSQYHLQMFQEKGLAYLSLKPEHQQTLGRLQLAHFTYPDAFPSFDESDLKADCENWLEPFLSTHSLAKLDFTQAFLSRLPWTEQQALNGLFPLTLTLPTKRQANIDYLETPPVVRAKLQECFGLTQSPTIAQGKVTLNLHLLSPAQRPLAMTQDLAFFWKEAYPEVRKENRGRYAKHPWPEDPLTAIASGQTKKRMEQQ